MIANEWQPRHLLCGVCFILVGIVSWPVGIIACVTAIVLHLSRLIAGIVVLLSVLLLMILVLLNPNNVLILWQRQWIGYYSWLHFPIIWPTIHTWLVALPFGAMIGASMAFLLSWNKRVSRVIRHMASGKGQATLSLSPRRLLASTLQRRLAHLTSAAYQGGRVLGCDVTTGEYVGLTDAVSNLHTLILGATGAGKTESLVNLIESSLHRGWPTVIIDGKGDADFVKRIEHGCTQFQRRCIVFTLHEGTWHYDCLRAGGITAKKDRIVMLREWSEDHYRVLAEDYLQTVFAVLEKTNVRVDLLTLAKHLEPRVLYNLARQSGDVALCERAQQLQDKRHDIEGLLATINLLAHSEIGHLFDCSEGDVFNLVDAFNTNACVIFSLQALTYPSYSATLGKLIVNDLKALVGQQLNQAHKKPFSLYFDEFSVFAGPQVMTLINQSRGANAHVVLSTQSLSDFVQASNAAFLDQIVENCNNLIIHRQNAPSNAEKLANLIGTVDDMEITAQVSVEDGKSRSGSVRAIKAYRVHPDVIKRLARGEAILVTKTPFCVQQVKVRRVVW